MLALGIDPGTATTGYGFVRELEQGELVAVAYGVIETSPHQRMELRLSDIYHKILELILLHQPDCCAVEKLFFQKNVKTALAVGQARGVVMLALAENQIPIAEYTPLEVKQAVVGYGGADKNQVQQMVKALLMLEKIPKPDDAADALAIAICHLHRYRLSALLKE
jgi:crossover junction endodeoxyribonuclease RuvC